MASKVELAADGYVADFVRDFGSAPDLDDASDREHASAYLIEVDDLGGIGVADWYGAIIEATYRAI